jgi:spore germination cell wall hydrolase CwlJ-like protein
MDDPTILALCAFEEANLEPDDGLAAVVRVVLNRQRLKYQSDGTVHGTVYWPNAFSWTEWQMIAGRYTKVAHSPIEVAQRSNALLETAQGYHTAWARAQRISAAVAAGTYSGADYDQLTGATVMYLNPAISKAAWATADKEVCRIGHHTFFHA